MKLRADLKLVKQLDYVTEKERDFSYCSGCVFYTSSRTLIDGNLCERVNQHNITCGADMIWVIDEEQWNSYRRKHSYKEKE